MEILLTGGFGIAFSVGLLTGIFGVGGGFLMTPALIILLGLPAPISVGTGLATFLATSSVGIFKRRNSDTMDLKLALTIAAGSTGGVYIGLIILETLKGLPPLLLKGSPIDTVSFILLVSFLPLLVGIASYFFLDYHRHNGLPPDKRVGLFAHVKLPPYGHYSSLEQSELPVIMLILLGVTVGLLTGLMGIGGGVILWPALIYLVGQRAVKASGTSLVLVWVSSLVAVVLNTKQGNIHYPLLAVMLTGGIAGTMVGTQLGLRISGPKLRLSFIYVILAAIVMIGVKVLLMIFGGSV